MFCIYYNKIKTLPETFYKKNSDFCTKIRCQFLKKPIKPKKTRFEVGFFGFYWAGFLLPTLYRTVYSIPVPQDSTAS
jgi:hypothetical protein